MFAALMCVCWYESAARAVCLLDLCLQLLRVVFVTAAHVLYVY